MEKTGQNTKIFKFCLSVGLILLDIWWVERSGGSLPQSLDLLDIADAGINLSVLVLVGAGPVHKVGYLLPTLLIHPFFSFLPHLCT
jgi:hypothetical protein